MSATAQKYRLRYHGPTQPIGLHIANDPVTGKERTYRPGDVVESTTDLATLWPEKFERLPYDSAQPQNTAVAQAAQTGFSAASAAESKLDPRTSNTAPTSPPIPPVKTATPSATLDSMNTKELQAFAAEEEIDLRGATKREDILRILKASGV